MRNLQHGPVEGRDVELVAAEHPRLQRAIKAGVEERLVQFLRIEAALNDRFYRRSHLSSTWINIDDAAAKVMLRALRARIGARR